MDSRARVFVYEVLWLVGLWTAAGLYFEHDLHPPTFGSLPVGVLWFGGLGAVLVSLSAVFDHFGPAWNPSWELWHYSRPLVGATVAAVSVLIVQAGIVSIGSDPTPGSGTGSIPRNLLYYLVAFLVGYREATFRDLVKKLADLVLKPSGDTAPTIGSITPSTGPAAATTIVSLTGTGLGTVASVHVGSAAAAPGACGDTYVVVAVPPGAGPGAVPITVETKTGSAAATFTYT